MRRDELDELHYITAIANVPSIYRRGILSHREAQRVRHESISMSEVQEKRAKIVVPGGRRLHKYVNLYVCARNPMLFKRQAQHAHLCVLRVSPDVLDLPGVVITDANASSKYALFAASPQGLRIVDRQLTFAEDWTDPDPISYWRRKSAKCAEVLVPDRVDPRFLMGAYLSCEDSLARVDALQLGLQAIVNRHLFFL